MVSDLASKMKRTAAEVVKKLFAMGMMVGVNATIDYDTAYLIADEFGVKVQKEVVVTIEDRLFEEEADSEESLKERAPVVCVMGHVDHGKTSHFGCHPAHQGHCRGSRRHHPAHRCVPSARFRGHDITFLDTPGHEAFTAMRARGAQVDRYCHSGRGGGRRHHAPDRGGHQPRQGGRISTSWWPSTKWISRAPIPMQVKAGTDPIRTWCPRSGAET